MIPDGEYYRPLFSPWHGFKEFGALYDSIRPYTLVSSDRCYVLSTLARQSANLRGEFWECGVYKGGTAMLLGKVLEKRGHQTTLRLFDTFQGMPDTDPSFDLHKKGDFADTSLNHVVARVEYKSTIIHEGLIPDSFAGLDNTTIAFAHIDVDIFSSVLACCEFIQPRLAHGGIIVFDDYGFSSCPGARKAVDSYYENRAQIPLVLPTGQAIVFNAPI